jgi:very-short-patch-repair endonuclease
MKDWKYNYLIKQIQKTAYKAHENFIIGSLLHDENLNELKPVTQHYVKRNDEKYALIDLFYPQLNLAVEIDEPSHEKNIEEDLNRQIEIEKNLKCNFFRIKINDGEIFNQINNLKKYINNLKEEIDFKIWEEPKNVSIFELKKELKNTMFVKIKGFIKPENLMERQTGVWIIDNSKIKNINKVVVVHDNEITRVFKISKWVQYGNKKGYSGIEQLDDNLLYSIITDWKFQATRIYSLDVY